MSGRQISVIYFYLVSAASLALIVVGIFSVVNFFINITQYDKYPLQYHEDCTMYSARPVKIAPTEEVFTEEEKREQKKQCEERITIQRKKQKLDDLKNAITFPIVGLVLFVIHFPRAVVSSKEK